MSKIEWTQETWNPIVGCSIISPGCTNCYAMAMASRIEAMNAAATPTTGLARRYDGLTKKVNGKPVWTGKVALAPDNVLLGPLKRRKPTTYFVNSMGDLFHEDVPDDWIDKVFAVMALTPQHTYQVLTKRAARMHRYLAEIDNEDTDLFERVADRGARMMEDGDNVHDMLLNMDWPLPNVWLGVSTERQQEADERILDLLATPAAVRFISAEPLLGPIDLTNLAFPKSCECERHAPTLDALNATVLCEGCCEGPERMDIGKLDWVIVGGESSPDARPMHPDWARSLRDQCSTAGVPFFFKQWGEWKVSLDRDRDDPDWRADYKFDYVDEGKSKWLNLAGGCGFHGERFCVMAKVGKKWAGRALDGLIHDEMPEAGR